MSETERNFREFGLGFQERTVQCLFEDHAFADMMIEVLEPEYFTYAHLKELSARLFDYRRTYKEFPSLDCVVMQVAQDERISNDQAVLTLIASFVERCHTTPLNGDRAWIEETALEFCKRQCIVKAIGESLHHIEGKNYEAIAGTVRTALNRGQPKDYGHEYQEDMEARAKKSVRQPISTGWPVMDRYLNGGWERKTLATFIAPTGAGKSMFLVNCACALVEQGLNVLYVTLEMADYKIGLRADSWYSGIAINDVPNNQERVKAAIDGRAKGRLIIKEFPTKRASVDTIRSFIQRLRQVKGVKIDALVIDYLDLMKSSRSYGEKRHELEGNYEEARGLAQEEDLVCITADQTNRGGLDLELVTLASISESYAKATVCDLIVTISRTVEDKVNGTGRCFIVKSRLGEDGVILPFLMQPATVKVTVLDRCTDPISAMLQSQGEEGTKRILREAMASGSRKGE